MALLVQLVAAPRPVTELQQHPPRQQAHHRQRQQRTLVPVLQPQRPPSCLVASQMMVQGPRQLLRMTGSPRSSA